MQKGASEAVAQGKAFNALLPNFRKKVTEVVLALS